MPSLFEKNANSTEKGLKSKKKLDAVKTLAILSINKSTRLNYNKLDYWNNCWYLKSRCRQHKSEINQNLQEDSRWSRLFRWDIKFHQMTSQNRKCPLVKAMEAPMTVLSPIELSLVFRVQATLQTATKEKITLQHRISKTKFWSAVASLIASNRNSKQARTLQRQIQMNKIQRKSKKDSK